MKTTIEKELSTDQPRTIRDASDGKLKIKLPDPGEASTEKEKKEEVKNG